MVKAVNIYCVTIELNEQLSFGLAPYEVTRSFSMPLADGHPKRRWVFRENRFDRVKIATKLLNYGNGTKLADKLPQCGQPIQYSQAEQNTQVVCQTCFEQVLATNKPRYLYQTSSAVRSGRNTIKFVYFIGTLFVIIAIAFGMLSLVFGCVLLVYATGRAFQKLRSFG